MSRWHATSLFGQQDRAPAHKVPSLNINTNREAENPSVAGGAAVVGNDPVPWVAWQEKDGAARKQPPPTHSSDRAAARVRSRASSMSSRSMP